MSDLDPMHDPEQASVSRRNVLRYGAAGAVAAWSVPVILTLQASPAGAASNPPSVSTAPQNVTPSGPQPAAPPSTGDKLQPSQATVPEDTTTTAAPGQRSQPTTTPTTVTGVQGVAVADQPATTTPGGGGLAFTGAEIGGLVVLGTGAVALGTAAVWSARHRDEDDELSPPADVRSG
jgi:hypothetical protein